MANETTAQLVARLEELQERATARPWIHDSRVGMDAITTEQQNCLASIAGRSDALIANRGGWMRDDGMGWNKREKSEADFALIVAAVNALPELLAIVKEHLSCCEAKHESQNQAERS